MRKDNVQINVFFHTNFSGFRNIVRFMVNMSKYKILKNSKVIEIYEELCAALTDNNITEIFVIGHSFGGAIISAVAMLLNQNFDGQQLNKLKMATFGSLFIPSNEEVQNVKIVHYMACEEVVLRVNGLQQPQINLTNFPNVYKYPSKPEQLPHQSSELNNYPAANTPLFVFKNITPTQNNSVIWIYLLDNKTPTNDVYNSFKCASRFNTSVVSPTSWDIHNNGYKLLMESMILDFDNILKDKNISENNLKIRCFDSVQSTGGYAHLKKYTQKQLSKSNISTKKTKTNKIRKIRKRKKNRCAN
jgi:hypothetical protein